MAPKYLCKTRQIFLLRALRRSDSYLWACRQLYSIFDSYTIVVSCFTVHSLNVMAETTAAYLSILKLHSALLQCQLMFFFSFFVTFFFLLFTVFLNGMHLSSINFCLVCLGYFLPFISFCLIKYIPFSFYISNVFHMFKFL